MKTEITTEDRRVMTEMGSKGGKANMARMTAEEKRAMAQKMATARWAKYRAERQR